MADNSGLDAVDDADGADRSDSGLRKATVHFLDDFSSGQHIKVWRLCLDGAWSAREADGDGRSAQCVVDTYSLSSREHRKLANGANVAVSRCYRPHSTVLTDGGDNLYLLVYHTILLRFDAVTQTLAHVAHCGLPTADCLDGLVGKGAICAVPEADGTDSVYFCCGWSGPGGWRQTLRTGMWSTRIARRQTDHGTQCAYEAVGEWAKCADMPWAVAEHGMIGHNGILIVTGGDGTKRYSCPEFTSRCAAFIPCHVDQTSETCGRWVRLPDLHQPRACHQMLVLDNKVIVIGGYHHQAHDVAATTLEALDINVLDSIKARPIFREDVGKWTSVTLDTKPTDPKCTCPAWRSVHQLTPSSAILTTTSDVEHAFYKRIDDMPGLPPSVARLDGTQLSPISIPDTQWLIGRE